METQIGPEKHRRTSAFHEIGLFEDSSMPAPRPKRPRLSVRFRTKESIISDDTGDDEWEECVDSDAIDDSSDLEDSTFPPVEPMLRQSRITPIHRLSVLVLMLAMAIPLAHFTSFAGRSHLPPLTATGVPFSEGSVDRRSGYLSRRQNSPTDVCKRWAQASAIVNGTLYLYGGEASTQPDQTSNTWNNDFITLDLTKTWQISNPPLNGLPQPSGPPVVAEASLWNSFDSLFLYGGEFSDNPVASPAPFALWEYNIPSSSWISHNNPQTTSGQNSLSGGQAIQRVAEGAGYSMANLGRGWYFGGHEDYLTTAGWSDQIARIYLSSFIEYTYPGYKSGDGQTAGSDGLWRNITSAGIQNTAGFTDRADGLLIYVPGFGAQGILLSLAGGTNDTFTQMNEVNVYDIAASQWYNQATSGPMPTVRVNPCAVVAAAPDGSSYNIYMFGGQNLVPYDNQTQFNDMWILSIPSFTWIEVNQNGQSTPYARAGHTCNIWDGQMVVVGGYIDPSISCESPGIYIFNLTSLQWVNQFTALTGPQASSGSFNSDSYNPFSQQENQRGTDEGSGLQGSYGYQVPDPVQSAVGGDGAGGATITAPIQSATAGPMASGKPQTYTITTTNAAGAVVTETGVSGVGGGSLNNQGVSNAARDGAIAAGVVAFVLLIVASYLGFCTYVYRKQLQLYKSHVAAAQRAAADPSRAEKRPFFAGPFGAGFNDSGNTRPSGGMQNDSFWARYRQSSESQGNSAGQSGGNSGGNSGGSASGSGARGHQPQDSIGSSSGGQQSHVYAGSEGGSSSEDLLEGREPTFVGVMLHPRRSLRVINRD